MQQKRMFNRKTYDLEGFEPTRVKAERVKSSLQKDGKSVRIVKGSGDFKRKSDKHDTENYFIYSRKSRTPR